MDHLNHFTQLGLEKLAAFPTQHSSAPSGLYVIKHAEEDNVEASDDEIQTKIWFKSPPLWPETLRRIRGIKLFAESHDQGFCNDESAGNWTWFELAILQDESSTTPKTTKDGVKLIWTSHTNKLCSDDFEWIQGEYFDERRDLLGLLEEGNVIAVRMCARFAAWCIHARNGFLVIDVGDKDVDRKTVYYGPIISKINKIEETLREVNEETHSAFLPSLPVGIKTAEVMERGNGEPPLRVLSFDGGGVRGLSSLLTLKAVMDKVSPDKKLKPCDVFDMIGGTSTGGLIAIMLGRLRMSVDECIEQYQKFMGTIFEHGWLSKAKTFLAGGELYSAATLETIIKELIRDRLGGDDVNLFDEVNGLANDEKKRNCKVFVMAVRADAANNRAPVFLRSYTNPLNPSLLPGVKIWEAARATSAAPYYFSPIQVGNYKLVDGGLGANNPLGWLWTEVLGVFGASRETSCFLSIGTGISANRPVPTAGLLPTFGRMEDLASIATNSEIMHVLFNGLIDSFAPKTMSKKYWRLNVGEHIPEWEEDKGWWRSKVLHLDNYKDVGKLDDLAALKVLTGMTRAYIEVNGTLIDECVLALGDSA